MAMNRNFTTATVPLSEDTAMDDSKFYLIPLTFLSSFLIISGNILTIVAIATNPPLQTRSNAFVASLAVADVVVGVAVFSFGLWLVPSVRNFFESAIYICITQLANALMSICVSIYSMLLVAIDRWLIISKPFLYQRIVTKKVIAGSILLPWLFGLIFGFSQFFILNPDQDPPVCRIISLYPAIYYNWITPAMYYFAVFGIFCFYFHIILIARHHGKAIQRQNRVHANLKAADDKSAMSINSSQPKSTTNNDRNARGVILKFNEQHWKAAKMMMTVFGVFFICWTPRIVLFSFGTVQSGVLSDVTINMGLINSGVNFLVYPLHSQDFRTAFKKIVCFRRYN